MYVGPILFWTNLKNVFRGSGSDDLCLFHAPGVGSRCESGHREYFRKEIIIFSLEKHNCLILNELWFKKVRDFCWTPIFCGSRDIISDQWEGRCVSRDHQLERCARRARQPIPATVVWAESSTHSVITVVLLTFWLDKFETSVICVCVCERLNMANNRATKSGFAAEAQRKVSCLLKINIV